MKPAVAIAAVLLALTVPGWNDAARAQAGKAAKPEAFRTATWEELMPKGWDPLKSFRETDVSELREGSAQELAMMETMREIWDNAPTRSELNGARLRLPGYVVPLDAADGLVAEFLLVPYFGACIHTPPPPANQIVHVVLRTPKKIRTMDAVWVSGILRAQAKDSPMGKSGYAMQAVSVEPYQAPKR